MPRGPSFYCERCGDATFLDGTHSGAHYCVACRLFTCNHCWQTDAHACAVCAANLPIAVKGLSAARPMLATLRGIHSELADISAREVQGTGSANETVAERRLLAVKSASLSRAIAIALLEVKPRHALTAAALLRAANVEAARIAGVGEAEARLPAGPLRRPMNWIASFRRSRAGLEWLPMALPILVVLAVAYGAGFLLLSQRPSANDVGLAVVEPTPEGQVAGGAPTRSPQPTSTAVARRSPVQRLAITFDELIIDAPPEGWNVLGGTASAAAFPNAVDRSIRLMTGDDSTQALLCTPLPKGARFVTLELSARRWAGSRVKLDSRDASFGLEVGPAQTAASQPSGNSLLDQPLETGIWYQAGIALDPEADVVEVWMRPRQGARGLQTEPVPPGWSDGSPSDARLCISAPDGGELFVDNVIIE